MKQLLGAVVGCLGFVLLVSTGCGGSSFEGGGAGGSESGGKASAGSGGSAMSGGSDPGGSASGGTTSGGSAMGGMPSAGSPSGGLPSGGTAGDLNSCDASSDCTDCAYPTAPLNEAECYCATCAAMPMAKAACAANQAEFAKVCTMPRPCPAIACILPPTPVCRSHQCVAK